MKSISYKIFFGAALLLITATNQSCKKDVLEMGPKGLTEDAYFSNEDEFDKAIVGIYAKMTDFFWFRGNPGNSPISVFLLPGDDITTNQSSEEFEIFSMQPADGRLDWLYTRHYQMINRAVVAIDKINTAKEDVYTNPDLKNHHKGEALFLKGYAYYNLWNFFGTAPLLLERPTDPAQFTPPGTTGTQLLDQAIKDFEEATTLLPVSWTEANSGRVTANSAYGMLGKALVFRASATKNAADYTAAIAAFNKISGPQLVANFNDNFAWDTENNVESLFEFQAGQPSRLDNPNLENDFDNAVGAMGIFWGFYSGEQNGLRGRSRFYGTTKLLNAYNESDPRRDSTLDPSNRFVRKYASRDRLTTSNVQSFNNYRILRYADVLLLKAEAILQSGGATTEAIDLLNQVRARARAMSPAGVEPADRPGSETDKAVIMDWIMTERFLELAGEGQRWFDLRRWHMQGVVSLNSGFFSSNLSTVSFQDPKHLNFPIPNSEINVNTNVTQNPGY